MDEQERELERQLAGGDISVLPLLAQMRIRRGDWTTFVQYRLQQGTPLRNIEIVWHLGHPGIRQWAEATDAEIRPLIGAFPTTSFNIIFKAIDNCFYCVDLLWEMYSAELKPLIAEYLQVIPTIHPNDRFWLEHHLLIDDAIHRIQALDDDITNIDAMSIPASWSSFEFDYSDPNAGEEPTPLWDLKFAEYAMNAISSIYYNHYRDDDPTVVQNWLYEGAFAVEIPGSVADRMIRVLNIIGMGLNFTRDAYILLKQGRENYNQLLRLDYKSPESFKLDTDYWNHIKETLVYLLLNDVRPISNNLDNLFGTVV